LLVGMRRRQYTYKLAVRSNPERFPEDLKKNGKV
jgi:hypothetical protein